MSNDSNIPLNLQKSFSEYASTDWAKSADAWVPSKPPVVETSYNLDESRANGNVMFKRYPDGKLDLEWCKNVVVDCIHKAKQLVPLTDIEKVILQVHFPQNFDFDNAVIADKMRRVNLQITDEEMMIISVMVANHLQYEVTRVLSMRGF